MDLSKNQRNSFSLNLFLRGVWTYFLQPLVRWLPKRCSPMRVFFLRLMGANIDNDCLVDFGVRVLIPWNLSMRAYSVLGRNVDVYNFSNISIGANTVISQDCVLCTGSHDYKDEAFPLVVSPISIGSSVWVAAQTFVLPGIFIGDQCVIGACSVVTRDVPTGEVWAGNPASFVKLR